MSSLLERRDTFYDEISTGKKPSSPSSHRHGRGLPSSHTSSQEAKCDEEYNESDEPEKESKLAASIADALKDRDYPRFP